MWTLEGNEASPGVIHYLPCGADLMVSRRDGHVLLTGDSSISRQHASLRLTHIPANLKTPDAVASVQLTDLGAKYGTFVNDGIQRDQKMPERSVVELKDGDWVRFGMFTNSWRLVHHGLVVTTSAVQPESKSTVSKALLTLGGHLVPEWGPNCSYLIMNAITLTVKVVCALASGQHIVTPEFLTSLADAVVTRNPHPTPAEYHPPLQEVSISGTHSSFTPNKQRQKVLSGTTFLFHNPKQFKRMGLAVTLAGGKIEELSGANYQHLASSPPTHILVQPPPDKPTSSPLYTAASKLLREHNLATIPESEIGLAILFISTQGHCNPAFRMASILKRSASATSQPTQGLKIYATETQDTSTECISLTGTHVVGETGQTTAIRPTPTPPTPSAPPPISLTASSATIVSLFTPDIPPQRKGFENGEENGAVNTRKRPHTGSGESGSPAMKRSNSRPTVSTQPLQDQDNVPNLELSRGRFDPPHVSTQREKVTTPSTSAPDTTNRKDSSLFGTSLDKTTITMPEATVERSVSMVPYTLPSLKTETLGHEDDVLTQPFVPIKQEVATQEAACEDDLLDEPDFRSGKRRREERPANDLLLDEDEWMGGGKKNKKTNDTRKTTEDTTETNGRPDDNINRVPERPNRRSLKTERVSIDGNNSRSHQGAANGMKQEPENLFALPSLSGRRSRMVGQTTGTSNNNDANLFALPQSSRAAQRRRMAYGSTPEPAKQAVSEAARVPGADLPTQPARVPPDIPSSHPAGSVTNNTTLQNMGENCDVTQGFISNKSASTVKRSPSEQEAVVKGRGGVPREEDRAIPGDLAVGEISGAFERSLVVVEVASLVRSPPPPPTPTSKNDASTTLKNGQVNFKRFRKNVGDLSILPRILGGTDLVAHDSVNNPRRDSWLRENPELTREMEGGGIDQLQAEAERPAPATTAPAADLELFPLAAKPRRRRLS